MRKLPHHELTGWIVGAKRWPYRGLHPATWRQPWKGEVLAIDDPRAWENRIAFPNRTPTHKEATAHVRQCIACGLISKTVPVLWYFDKPTVHWEMVDNLCSYEDDATAWEEERSSRLALWKPRGSEMKQKEPCR